jgi:hypothetical protein
VKVLDEIKISTDMTKEIQKNAMDIIEELKKNKDLANFVEELEEQNRF